MKNDFLIACKYNGSEEYTNKDGKVCTLHSFNDSVGNVFKFSSDSFSGKVGNYYSLCLRVGDLRKDGVYTKYWKITPTVINKCDENKEAK